MLQALYHRISRVCPYVVCALWMVTLTAFNLVRAVATVFWTTMPVTSACCTIGKWLTSNFTQVRTHFEVCAINGAVSHIGLSTPASTILPLPSVNWCMARVRKFAPICPNVVDYGALTRDQDVRRATHHGPTEPYVCKVTQKKSGANKVIVYLSLMCLSWSRSMVVGVIGHRTRNAPCSVVAASAKLSGIATIPGEANLLVRTSTVPSHNTDHSLAVLEMAANSVLGSEFCTSPATLTSATHQLETFAPISAVNSMGNRLLQIWNQLQSGLRTIREVSHTALC